MRGHTPAVPRRRRLTHRVGARTVSTVTPNPGERDLWAAPLSDVPVPAAVRGRRLTLSELALCGLLWLGVAYVGGGAVVEAVGL